MSSVLIKGMKMPKNCWECSLSDIDDDFGRCCLYSGIACLTIGRQDSCQLVEIPTPHGRLIDADLLYGAIEEDFNGVWVYDVSPSEAVSDMQTIVDCAPTVIEAEVSTK